jgi:tRNA (guanosine-2'-O-)-methyltransferase
MPENMKNEGNLLAPFVVPERLERFEKVLNERTANLCVVLDEVHNEHNVSAVIRSADAFGLCEVFVTGEHFRHNVGITMGAERWLKIHRIETAEETRKILVERGFQTVILQPADYETNGTKSVSVSELPFEEKLALVFGNEKRGVSETFKSSADYFAYIPMYGFVDSFNVSVAAGICLFASTVAKGKPTRRVQTINEQEKEALRSQWLKDDIRGSELILERIKKS